MAEERAFSWDEEIEAVENEFVDKTSSCTVNHNGSSPDLPVPSDT